MEPVKHSAQSLIPLMQPLIKEEKKEGSKETPDTPLPRVIKQEKIGTEESKLLETGATVLLLNPEETVLAIPKPDETTIQKGADATKGISVVGTKAATTAAGQPTSQENIPPPTDTTSSEAIPEVNPEILVSDSPINSEIFEIIRGVGVALIGTAGIAYVVSKSINIFKKNEVVKKAQERLAQIDQTLKSLDSQIPKTEKEKSEIIALKTTLENESAILKQLITSEIEAKKNMIMAIVGAAMQTGTISAKEATGFSADMLKAGTTAAQATSIATATLGGVLSVLTIALSSKALYENRQLDKKIEAEKIRINFEKLHDVEDPFLNQFYDLRLQNLKQQQHENKVLTVKNAFSLTAGVIGTVAATKGIIAVAGVTIGTTLGIALSATGIGAGVIAGAALLIGIGYLIYKHRKAIAHALAIGLISSQYLFGRFQMKLYEGEKALREIAKQKLKTEPIPEPKSVDTLQPETSIQVEKLEVPLSPVNQKIQKQFEKLKAIKEREKQIQERYQYEKYVVKFGLSHEEGHQELKELHENLYAEMTQSPEKMDKLKDFCMKQNDQIKVAINPTQLKEGISKEKFWEISLAILTAPVAA